MFQKIIQIDYSPLKQSIFAQRCVNHRVLPSIIRLFHASAAPSKILRANHRYSNLCKHWATAQAIHGSSTQVWTSSHAFHVLWPSFNFKQKRTEKSGTAIGTGARRFREKTTGTKPKRPWLRHATVYDTLTYNILRASSRASGSRHNRRHLDATTPSSSSSLSNPKVQIEDWEIPVLKCFRSYWGFTARCNSRSHCLHCSWDSCIQRDSSSSSTSASLLAWHFSASASTSTSSSSTSPS